MQTQEDFDQLLAERQSIHEKWWQAEVKKMRSVYWMLTNLPTEPTRDNTAKAAILILSIPFRWRLLWPMN